MAVFAEHHIFKQEKYLKMAFEKFDIVLKNLSSIRLCIKDKNGKINAIELRNILGGGSIVPLDKVEKVIRQADTNGDGEVS